jgi:hypothetical protein
LSADLTDDCLSGCHLEVKYRKRHAVWKFMQQAIRDSKGKRVPVVLLRADGREDGQGDDFLMMFRIKDAEEVANAIILNTFERMTEKENLRGEEEETLRRDSEEAEPE